MTRNPAYAEFRVGDWTYGTPEVVRWNRSTQLTIGRYCSLAAGVAILLGGEHRTDWVTTYPFTDVFPEAAGFPGHPHTKGDIAIGNDVWVGREAVILSGVRVGDGAVIGARSLVTRDVPPYAIAAGVPARVLRFRFEPAVVAGLLRIAWWDWPDDQVRANWPLLLSDRLAEFVARFDPDVGAGT